MNSRARLTRDFNEAGALSKQVNLDSFIGNDIFLTKDGSIGKVIALEGREPEGRTAAQLGAYVKAVRAAFRNLGPNMAVYTYLSKQSKPEIPFCSYDNPIVAKALRRRSEHLHAKAHQLFSIGLHVVLLRKSGVKDPSARNKPRGLWTKLRRIVRAFSAAAEICEGESELSQTILDLNQKVGDFVAQLADTTGASILDKHQAFAFFRQMLNPDRERARTARLKYDSFLDQTVGDCDIECHREFLRIGDHGYVRVLTLKEPPSSTMANMLKGIEQIPADFTLVTEWHSVDPNTVRGKMRQAEIHNHNTKVGLSTQMRSSQPAAHEILVNPTKEALVEEIGEARKRMEMDGLIFGEFSLSIVVHADSLQELNRAVAEIEKEFGRHDAVLYRESYNLTNGYFATLPGGYFDNLRRIHLSLENAADLFPLFVPSVGQKRDPHLNAENAFLFETLSQTLYHYSLFVADVAHTFVIGGTGSGKTVLLQSLALALQKYSPAITCILHLGSGYEGLSRLLGGGYIKMGVGAMRFTINWFSLEPTRENVQFIFIAIKTQIESDGGARLTATEDNDLYAEIENVFVLAPPQRRLGSVAIGIMASLAERLAPWVGEGRYGAWFDNEIDTFAPTSFQSFDLEGMENYPEPLEVLVLDIIHRLNRVVYDPQHADRLKIVIIDEAWRFFRNPAVRAYITEALKTWRKRNGAMILATQSTEDLRQSDIAPHLVENCLTKFFLANAGMDANAYQEMFDLNDAEIELIKNLTPKFESFLKRPGESKVLRLTLDARSRALFTSNPFAVKKRNELVSQLGLEAALDALAKEEQ